MKLIKVIVGLIKSSFKTFKNFKKAMFAVDKEFLRRNKFKWM